MGVKGTGRRLAATAAGAAALTGGWAIFATPAGAEERQITVTLIGGQTVTVTVDVPPGTPLDQVPLPPLKTPVVSVTEGAAPAPAAAPAKPASSGSQPAKAKRGKQGKKEKTATAPSVFAPALGSLPTPKAKAKPRKAAPGRALDGTPLKSNPTFTLALPGPVGIGVPDGLIESFRVPPFLLPLYQAAGVQYGVRWEVLAAINEIETDYGRNLNVSSAGAVGWMQFMPATWKAYGVDANRDGVKDPYNPMDAIFAAARYLQAAGADKDIRKAIFAYNHADWYVDSVVMRARLIAGLPADLVGSLTGLAQGLFPVNARAKYADDVIERSRGRGARVPSRRDVRIFAKSGSPVVAVQDAKVVRIFRDAELGRTMMVRDTSGNTYTYAGLGEIARRHPVPRPGVKRKGVVIPERLATMPTEVADAPTKERVFAEPDRTLEPLPPRSALGVTGLKRADVVLRRLGVGSRVIAGAELGRIGRGTSTTAPHLAFGIRPAGRGAPRIDPKPILDGWKLLEATSLNRANGRNALVGALAERPTVGQVLLMSKAQLAKRVLDDPRITIHDCGRQDIRSGAIDRRLLATLAYLSANGMRLGVTSLKCGREFRLTSSGNVSQHSFGGAVDIASVNGLPILGNQGKGSVTDMALSRLVQLQGQMRPDQIISLMTVEGASNTIAMADHADHIHIGFREASEQTEQAAAILKPSQWGKLLDRLGTIENPSIRASAEE